MANPSHYFDELLIHHRLPLAVFPDSQGKRPKVMITNSIDKVHSSEGVSVLVIINHDDQ